VRLYRICKWSELFENNRSKTVKELAWVLIPNRHDGENYTGIITHKDGAIIYAAWILIVQVASRCQPRGTLLRDNGKPHDSASLSLKTRAPKEWFDIALKYLTEETDWLEYEDVAVACRRPVTQMPSTCQPPDDRTEQNELNGTEQKSAKQGEPKTPSAHREFTDRWTSKFHDTFGFGYRFQGSKDGKAVKALIESGELVESLLSTARAAWVRSKQMPKSFACCQSVTIHGFNEYLNQIRADLSAAKPQAESKQIQETISVKSIL
jgi:hypothetical protein